MAAVVGITAYAEPITRGFWPTERATFVTQPYIDKVYAAGGLPLVVPPRVGNGADWAHAVLDRLDALIIGGGADLDPQHYQADPHPLVQEYRPDRDDSELALVRAAVERDLPLLGICRGMQVMAVAAGGSLDQHVPDRVGHYRHSPTVGQFGSHPVRTRSETRLRALLGEHLSCPTYHHQSVLTHPSYEPAADADDGVLEAIEAPDARWRFGVQWHPEVGEDPRLFDALVAAAR
ncbi:gamma-glutamyl-gamma-aminobutyrate hydrolase family protein [Flexivirga sp. ID2601S]|uniref:Gamma-glutamyl-gamma-aminobutyrate hydrolase family protein n=1 Tax=Flexivirga aerilata TaxID=1656889 RepID=A0A849ALQ4_9MICO|nr:gamma-glutamyl-gamma-aminobutyrate hydrolase family protein [Flexivirga aerilata]NNG40291.1 gamma-glutamyl-gamma-aminobutyrate hydrolase family protein [Flexivirga aerilata]